MLGASRKVGTIMDAANTLGDMYQMITSDVETTTKMIGV